MKLLVCLLTVATSSLAMADRLYCTGTKDLDHQIVVQMEAGLPVSAQFSNIEWGSLGDKTLAQGDFTLSGGTLFYLGEAYSCSY